MLHPLWSLLWALVLNCSLLYIPWSTWCECLSPLPYMTAVLMSGFLHKTKLPEGSLTVLLILLIFASSINPSTEPEREISTISKYSWTVLGEEGRGHSGSLTPLHSHHHIHQLATGWPSDQTISYVSKEVQHSIPSVLTSRTKKHLTFYRKF